MVSRLRMFRSSLKPNSKSESGGRAGRGILLRPSRYGRALEDNLKDISGIILTRKAVQCRKKSLGACNSVLMMRGPIAEMFSMARFFSTRQAAVNPVQAALRGEARQHRRRPAKQENRLPISYTYREQLYSARRFTAASPYNPGSAFHRLKAFIFDEGIAGKLKEKKRFIKPSVLRGKTMFASRKTRFNHIVSETIGKILKIHASNK